MDFHGLQENLRRLLLQRIHGGQLTGLRLARQAGLQQPHVSNFLNLKRGLSLEALDRVLAVQRLSITDLLDEEEIRARASIIPPAKEDFEDIVLVDAETASLQPRFARDQIQGLFKISKSFLERLRTNMEGKRSTWQRFIFLRVSAREGMSMYPRLLPGALVLVDRHYESLAPYHRSERNMYAVIHNARCHFRYAEQQGSYLVLHAENRSYAAHIVNLAGKSPCHFIVGRICSVQVET